jgi:hypothetical protein
MKKGFSRNESGMIDNYEIQEREACQKNEQ